MLVVREGFEPPTAH